MNTDTGRLEPLTEAQKSEHQKDLERRFAEVHSQLPSGPAALVRPDGSPVPEHWAIFTAGELVTVKDQTFKVAYMNECTLVLEPVKPEDALAKAEGELARLAQEMGNEG
jgi:hypothetical protein